MPIRLQQPVTIAVKTINANVYEISNFLFENRESGPALTISFNAINEVEVPDTRMVANPEYSAEDAAAALEAEEPYDVPAEIEESFTRVENAALENMPPLVLTGAELQTVMADAMARQLEHLATPDITPAQACYFGIRDALYAALEQHGRITVEE